MTILYVCSIPEYRLASHASSAIHVRKSIEAFRNIGNAVHVQFVDNNAVHRDVRYTYNKMRKKTPRIVNTAVRDIYNVVYDYYLCKSRDLCVAKNHFDFIYMRERVPSRLGVYLSKKFRIPLIIEVNAPVEERKIWGSPLFPVFKILQRKILNQADAVVSVSQALRAHLIREGIKPNIIHVLFNGVNISYPKFKDSGFAIRKKFRILDKIVVGAMVGSMRPWHRLDLLIKSARFITRKAKNVRFLMLGDFTNKLRYKINEQRLSENFIFTGNIPYDEIPVYIDAMDICVIPNITWYAVPIKAYEYGVLGKPIILPSAAVSAEVFTHGETALLFTPGDPQDLSHSVLQLVNNKKMRLKIGENIKNHVSQNFTWEKNAQIILSLYSELTHKQKI